MHAYGKLHPLECSLQQRISRHLLSCLNHTVRISSHFQNALQSGMAFLVPTFGLSIRMDMYGNHADLNTMQVSPPLNISLVFNLYEYNDNKDLLVISPSRGM